MSNYPNIDVRSDVCRIMTEELARVCEGSVNFQQLKRVYGDSLVARIAGGTSTTDTKIIAEVRKHATDRYSVGEFIASVKFESLGGGRIEVATGLHSTVFRFSKGLITIEENRTKSILDGNSFVKIEVPADVVSGDNMNLESFINSFRWALRDMPIFNSNHIEKYYHSTPAWHANACYALLCSSFASLIVSGTKPVE